MTVKIAQPSQIVQLTVLFKSSCPVGLTRLTACVADQCGTPANIRLE
ncbi:hypothetical protein [Undibacterium sp. TS12]|nr:hypothetical protein [Undibacterium sp. TS12]MCH8622465.1 hypothetical protein [Undibacterium sp. TS12]